MGDIKCDFNMCDMDVRKKKTDAHTNEFVHLLPWRTPATTKYLIETLI